MAKSPRQKLKLLYLADYFRRCTDEQHPATAAELIRYLEKQNIAAERKSLYSDLEALREYGMDILKVKAKQTGYYLGSREFELSELKLLVDSVQSSRFITQKKTLALIGKLENLTSVYESGKLGRQVYVTGRIKSMNESIYYSVDAIQEAIAAGKQISFRYFDYDRHGSRVFRREGGRYQVSPAGLMWDNEKYYLVCAENLSEQIKNFRVDKMAGVRAEEAAAVFPQGKPDMSRYGTRHFGMFSGQERQVMLEFDGSLAGAVFDRFGKDVILQPEENGRFSICVEVAVSPQFFGWLCGFGDLARLAAPADVAAAMAEHVRRIGALYRM